MIITSVRFIFLVELDENAPVKSNKIEIMWIWPHQMGDIPDKLGYALPHLDTIPP